MLKRKEGDTVRIQSQEWVDAQEKDEYGDINCSEHDSAINEDMYAFAGRLAKIIRVESTAYVLDIDGGAYAWEDWMFDPDYKADEPLSPEDAIRAMLDGETLYQRYKVIEKWNGTHFVYQILGNQEWHLKPQDGVFTGLYRRLPKRKRPMTRWEMIHWACGEESRGWVVRYGSENWSPPQCFAYVDRLDKYQRAKLLPDLSSVDKSTIQGFEVEEEAGK